MYYIYALTRQNKLITWECSTQVEARIVNRNICDSSLVDNLLFLELGNQKTQPWVKLKHIVDSEQYITYNSNNSYYYPRNHREDYEYLKLRSL